MARSGGFEGCYADALVSHPEQTSRVEFEELRAALAKLPADQRQALLLVGASDYSYDAAALMCGCAAGTIKSRVHRARTRLADLLAMDSVDYFWPRRARSAGLAGNGTARSTPSASKVARRMFRAPSVEFLDPAFVCNREHVEVDMNTNSTHVSGGGFLRRIRFVLVNDRVPP